MNVLRHSFERGLKNAAKAPNILVRSVETGALGFALAKPKTMSAFHPLGAILMLPHSTNLLPSQGCNRDLES